MSDQAQYAQRQQDVADALAASVARFAPLTWPTPVLLNSLFKAGTHLLRNILIHFRQEADDVHAPFIFDHQIGDAARRVSAGDEARFFVGHLAFMPSVVEYVGPFRQILLYRDPRTWVLAAGREFYQPDQQNGIAQWVQSQRVPLGDWLEVLITGGEYFEHKIEPLAAIYELRVLPWIPRAAHVVRYEDLLAHLTHIDAPMSRQFFFDLLLACDIEPPFDWRERVLAGASRAISATDSAFFMDPALDQKKLTPHQKALLDYRAPGLRTMLSYA